RRKRGFFAAWPQAGIPLGVALGYTALRASTRFVPNDYWAWRVPFLAGVLLLVVALFVRIRTLETPTFARLIEERRIEGRPVRTVLALQPVDVLLTCLVRLGEHTPFVIYTATVLVV